MAHRIGRVTARIMRGGRTDHPPLPTLSIGGVGLRHTRGGAGRRMGKLTESAAERLIAERAFTCGPPGFVGAAIDLPDPARLAPGAIDRPEVAGAARVALRHGFLIDRADGTVTVSGPPSPGLESCLAR